MVLLRLKKTILMIHLHVMTMLTKLFCALTVTSSEEYWSIYVIENDSKDLKLVHEGVQDSCNQFDQQVIVQTSF